jgi:hypothetical protein
MPSYYEDMMRGYGLSNPLMETNDMPDPLDIVREDTPDYDVNVNEDVSFTPVAPTAITNPNTAPSTSGMLNASPVASQSVSEPTSYTDLANSYLAYKDLAGQTQRDYDAANNSGMYNQLAGFTPALSMQNERVLDFNAQYGGQSYEDVLASRANEQGIQQVDLQDLISAATEAGVKTVDYRADDMRPDGQPKWESFYFSDLGTGDKDVARDIATDYLVNQLGVFESPEQLWKTFEIQKDNGEYRLEWENDAPIKVAADIATQVAATYLTAGGLGALGVTNTVAQGALGSGLMTASQGGNLEDIAKSAVLGAAGGYVKGLVTDVETLTNEIANNQAVASSAIGGEAAIAATRTAELTQQLADAQTALSVANDINNGVQFIEAAATGNVAGMLSEGLQIADMPSINNLSKDLLTNTVGDFEFVQDNIDTLSSATSKVAEELLNGSDLGDALEAGAIRAVQEGVDFGEGGLDLGLDFDSDILTAVGDAAETVYKDYVKPVTDTIENAVDPILDTAADVIEGVAEPVVSAAADAVNPVIDYVDENLSDFDDNVIQEVIDQVDGVVDYVDESLNQFDDEVIQSVVDGTNDVVDVVDDALSTFDDEVLQPLKDLLGDAFEGLGDLLSDLFRNQFTTGLAGRVKAQSPDSEVLDYLEPKLVKGFDLDKELKNPLDNPLLRG